MNCQAGDIAVITRGPLAGGLVECEDVCGFGSTVIGQPMWHVTPMSASTQGVSHVADSLLRPLRDKPGEDESLLWAPVPRVGAPA